MTAIVVDGVIAAWDEEVDDDGPPAGVVVEEGDEVDVGALVVVVVGVVVVVVVEVEEVVGVVVEVDEVEEVEDVGEGEGEPPLRVDSTSAIKEPTT